MKLKWGLCEEPPNAGETNHSPRSSSPGKGETLSHWEIPFGAQQWWLGEWDDVGKMKLSFFPFCAVVLEFFVPMGY